MEAVEFVLKDIQRGRKIPGILRYLILAVIIALPAALGLGLRDDIHGVWTNRVFLPNLGALLFLGLIPLMYQMKEKMGGPVAPWILCIGMILCLQLSMERVFFPGGPRTQYAAWPIFYQQTLKCFTKGAVTALIYGVVLTFEAFVISSWPSRRWRALLAVGAGLSSCVMLGFHCDSSSAGHVVLGHVVPGMILGFILFLFLEGLFHFFFKRFFPGISETMDNFRHLS